MQRRRTLADIRGRKKVGALGNERSRFRHVRSQLGVEVTFTDADTNEPISWGGSATLSVTNSPSASASCGDGGDSNNYCGTLVHSGASSVTFTITGASKAGYTWDGEVDSATIVR